MIAGLAGCGPLPERVEGSAEPATSSWHAISEGVYEKTEPNGAITRLSVGAAGAEHTRRELEARLGQAEAEARQHPGDVAAADRSRELKQALDVATQGAKTGGAPQSPIIPESMSSGLLALCTRYRYEFETSLTRGTYNVTVFAKTTFIPTDGFSPLPPAPTAVTVVSAASIKPTSSSAWNTVQRYSNVIGGVTVTATKNWDQVTPIDPTCTGYTSNQISVSSTLCEGLGYVSLEHMYTGCQP